MYPLLGCTSILTTKNAFFNLKRAVGFNKKRPSVTYHISKSGYISISPPRRSRRSSKGQSRTRPSPSPSTPPCRRCYGQTSEWRPSQRGEKTQYIAFSQTIWYRTIYSLSRRNHGKVCIRRLLALGQQIIVALRAGKHNWKTSQKET